MEDAINYSGSANQPLMRIRDYAIRNTAYDVRDAKYFFSARDDMSFATQTYEMPTRQRMSSLVADATNANKEESRYALLHSHRSASSY